MWTDGRYQHDDSKVIASVHDLISIIKKNRSDYGAFTFVPPHMKLL